jgi:hypothetical protein
MKAGLFGRRGCGFGAACLFDPFCPRDVSEGTVDFSQAIK